MLGGRSAVAPTRSRTEAGVNPPTLSKWLRDARTLRDVSKRKIEQEHRRGKRGGLRLAKGRISGEGAGYKPGTRRRSRQAEAGSANAPTPHTSWLIA